MFFEGAFLETWLGAFLIVKPARRKTDVVNGFESRYAGSVGICHFHILHDLIESKPLDIFLRICDVGNLMF
jgi:hypothetical protein